MAVVPFLISYSYPPYLLSVFFKRLIFRRDCLINCNSFPEGGKLVLLHTVFHSRHGFRLKHSEEQRERRNENSKKKEVALQNYKKKQLDICRASKDWKMTRTFDKHIAVE